MLLCCGNRKPQADEKQFNTHRWIQLHQLYCLSTRILKIRENGQGQVSVRKIPQDFQQSLRRHVTLIKHCSIHINHIINISLCLEVTNRTGFTHKTACTQEVKIYHPKIIQNLSKFTWSHWCFLELVLLMESGNFMENITSVESHTGLVHSNASDRRCG